MANTMAFLLRTIGQANTQRAFSCAFKLGIPLRTLAILPNVATMSRVKLGKTQSLGRARKMGKLRRLAKRHKLGELGKMVRWAG